MRRLEPGKSSAFGAIFIVINAALGAGLLAFPYAFYAAGGVAAGIGIELVHEYGMGCVIRPEILY